MKVNMTKQHRLRDGRQVKLYSDTGTPGDEIHGAIKTPNGWQAWTWPISGRFGKNIDNMLDLVEVKPSFNKEVWLNIYNGEYGLCVASGYATKRDADYGALKSRFACVSVTVNCEEGEGL